MLSLTCDGDGGSSTAVTGSQHAKSVTALKRLLPRLSWANNTAAPACSGEPCSNDDVIHSAQWLASPDGRLVLPVRNSKLTLVDRWTHVDNRDLLKPEYDCCDLEPQSSSWKCWCLMSNHQFNPKPIKVKQHQNIYSCTSKMVPRCFGFFFISVRVVTVDVILNLPSVA